MDISLEFKELASPCEGKPKGCYERVGDNYVSVWMGWVLCISDTHEGYGSSLFIQNFETKPTKRLVRKAKKLVW